MFTSALAPAGAFPALAMVKFLKLLMLQFPSQYCEDQSVDKPLRVVPGAEEECVCVCSYYLSFSFLILKNGEGRMPEVPLVQLWLWSQSLALFPRKMPTLPCLTLSLERVFILCREASHQEKEGLVGFWVGCPQITSQCLGDARQRSGEFPSWNESAV